MSEHSPLPWATDPDDRDGMEWNVHIVCAEQPHMRVCFMTSGPEAEANAAFICKAANAHDDLVTALGDVIRDINDYERVNNLAPNPGRTECWDSVARAKDLLASIKEQS